MRLITCEWQLYPQGSWRATFIGLRAATRFWVAITGANQVWKVLRPAHVKSDERLFWKTKWKTTTENWNKAGHNRKSWRSCWPRGFDALKPRPHSYNTIERFQSRGQHLCKFIGTKESVYKRKEFISHKTGLGHQHGRRFIVRDTNMAPWRHVKTLYITQYKAMLYLKWCILLATWVS